MVTCLFQYRKLRYKTTEL